MVRPIIRKFKANFRALRRTTDLALSSSKPNKAEACFITPILGKKRIENKWNETFQFDYMLKNCNFIHIGKCGGTSIRRSFIESNILIEETHLLKAPIDKTKWYVIWIRDPVSRFVSAFNHSKEILDFDISNIDPQKLSILNSPAPAKIYRRMTKGYAFSPEYDFLVRQFESANHLAESLSSTQTHIKSLALELMKRPEEHIFKGIGWYLDNGDWVEKFSDNILFVGSVECMDDDFNRLLKRLEIEEFNIELSNYRTGSQKLPKTLSSVGSENISNFYLESDWRALNILKNNRLIGDDLLKRYYKDLEN